jgi:hypothetical protein
VSAKKRTARGTSWTAVCELALKLPGVSEGTSYGTPALHVCGRFLARLKEDGETMAIKMDFADREVLLEMKPSVFFLTDHYRPYPAILVRLAKAPAGLVAEVLERAWRFQAPRNLLKREQGNTRSQAHVQRKAQVDARLDGLFRFPEAIRHDPAIEAWLARQAPGLGIIARRWFTSMRQCGRDVREVMHDGCPTACVRDAAFGYVGVFTAHANVGFFRGAELDDPTGLLQGSGRRMRHVKVKPDAHLDAAALEALVHAAYTDMKRRLAE